MVQGLVMDQGRTMNAGEKLPLIHGPCFINLFYTHYTGLIHTVPPPSGRTKAIFSWCTIPSSFPNGEPPGLGKNNPDTSSPSDEPWSGNGDEVPEEHPYSAA